MRCNSHFSNLILFDLKIVILNFSFLYACINGLHFSFFIIIIFLCQENCQVAYIV